MVQQKLLVFVRLIKINACHPKIKRQHLIFADNAAAL